MNKLTEEYITSKNWYKSTWQNGNIKFIYKEFSMAEHGFFISLAINFSNFYCKIVEGSHESDDVLFHGYLKTEQDFDYLWSLLEFSN